MYTENPWIRGEMRSCLDSAMKEIKRNKPKQYKLTNVMRVFTVLTKSVHRGTNRERELLILLPRCSSGLFNAG